MSYDPSGTDPAHDRIQGAARPTEGAKNPEDTDAASAGRRPTWPSATVAALFGLLFAYYLWDAIRSLVVLPAEYESLGLGRDAAPWTLLIIGVLIPVVVYGAALVVGLRRNVFARALLFLVGLATVASLSLGVIALGR